MLLNLRDRKIKLLYTATGLVVALACQKATAGAFQLHEQNTTYLGNAYSGTASTAEDCSTNFYNPAGLTELRHNQFLASGVYYAGHIKSYNGRGTTLLGTPDTGSATSKPSSKALIPALHASAKINHKWSVGLSVAAPFGLSTKYPSDSVARYVATKSSIGTTDITPSVAFKINDKFSLGAGFDALYVKATLALNVNAGTEAMFQNKGHSWGYGYHVGVLFKPSCCTQMGLTYFSQFTTTVKGDSTTTSALASLTARTSFTARVRLPDRLVYSLTHKYSHKWTALADVEWVHWNRLQDLTIVYNDATFTRNNLNYENTWRGALGANYAASDAWKLRAGIAFDESPVPSAYRKANLPDSNKFWLAVGAKWHWKKALALDIGYAHIFANKCSVINDRNGTTNATFTGNYKSSADLIGAQLTWSFM